MATTVQHEPFTDVQGDSLPDVGIEKVLFDDGDVEDGTSDVSVEGEADAGYDPDQAIELEVESIGEIRVPELLMEQWLPRSVELYILRLVREFPEETMNLLNRMLAVRCNRPLVHHMKGELLTYGEKGEVEAACAAGFLFLSYDEPWGSWHPGARLKDHIAREFPKFPTGAFIRSLAFLNDDKDLTPREIRNLFKKLVEET